MAIRCDVIARAYVELLAKRRHERALCDGVLLPQTRPEVFTVGQGARIDLPPDWVRDDSEPTIHTVESVTPTTLTLRAR